MTPDNPDKTSKMPKKNVKGQWIKGVSGNPAGRPKRKYTENEIRAQNQLKEYAPMITDAVLHRVFNGNWDAIKLCFDRIHPPAKENSLSIDLPLVNSAQSALDALSYIVDCAASGGITLSEAERLTAMVNKYLEHAHLPQLQKRLDKMERWVEANTLPDSNSEA